jgi:putative ABC transport system permease protein
MQLWQRLVLGALAFVDGLTLIGSTSLVYAVFASATQARRRQVGLLRVVGAERRQVMGTLMAEAILLGLIGSGLGLMAGLLFARVAAGLVLETGDVPHLPPAPLGWALAAVILGVLSSLGGALRPAMRAAWQSPLAALQAVTQPSRPMSGGRLPKGLSRLVRPFLAEAHLAAASLGRERGRAAFMVGTLAFVLSMFLGSVGVLSLLSGYLTDAFSRLTSGDYLVLPGLTTLSMRELTGQDTSDVPPLDAELLSALEGLGDRVWLMRGTTANVEALQVFPGQPTLLLDIEGYAQMGGFRFQSGDWPRALEMFRSGPAVLLTPVVARRLGVSLGEQVRLPTRQGPVDFDVAGIGDSEFTTCILDLADGATYLGANEVNGVAVKVRPGGDTRAVRRALLDAVQSHGGTLLSLSEAASQLRKVFRQAQTSISLLIGVTGVVAGLGVVNAMLASVAERRREIGMLRAVGATRRQVGRLILAEAAMLGALAALIGTALGWAATLLFLAASHFYLPGTTTWWAGGAAWLPLLMASLIGLVTWPLLAMLGGLAAAVHAAGLTVIRALYATGE